MPDRTKVPEIEQILHVAGLPKINTNATPCTKIVSFEPIPRKAQRRHLFGQRFRDIPQRKIGLVGPHGLLKCISIFHSKIIRINAKQRGEKKTESVIGIPSWA
jgi:hypothetical protein